MHSCTGLIRYMRLSCRVSVGLVAVWLLAFGPGAAYAAPGALDSTFGTGGKVTTDFGGLYDWANALVRQPDGKLVVAGSTSADGADNFALARYTANGSLDSTFGVGGKVTTDFSGTIDEATALILQPDGKLVAAGYALADGASDFALARYNVDGSLDLTFGGGTGKVTTNFLGLDWAFALVRQPDGKLVVAGSTSADGAENFALARYTANGSLDSTFGGGTGKVTTNFLGLERAFALVRQPDGKLVAAGYTATAGAFDFALARYTANGSLDSTFGVGGKVITDFFSRPDDVATALVVQPDGKLVAAGYSLADAGYDIALARYTANGSLDSTFGAGGQVITDFGNPDDAATALVVQPDGKLVAAGYTATAGGYDVALARYQGDGTAAVRALTMTKTSTGSGPESMEQRTFLTTDPIAVAAIYYDPNDACLGVNPATVKFFAFNATGQLVLGKNRDAASAPTNTVTNSQVGTSKHQALLANLAPGELPAGTYKLVFRVQDCASTEILVSKFSMIRVVAP